MLPLPFRRGGLGTTAVAAVTAVAASAPATPATPSCSSQRAADGAATLVLRRLNAVRAEHGAPRLRIDRTLARVARRHSRDMVRHRYFAHDSRSGARFSARIAHSGWMGGRRRWKVGENLAWGTGCSATAASIMAAWLRSPAHRHVLLDPGYRVVGIGVARGTPVARGHGGLTYTTDFGS
jgi:uncharacterized protein YkwD